MVSASVQEVVTRRGFDVDKKGQLLFEGIRLEDIAAEYGTPCYIYSEKIIRQQCQEYIKSFQNNHVDYLSLIHI